MRASVLLIALVVAVASVFALSEDVRADGSRHYGRVAVAVDGLYLSFGTSGYGHHYPYYRHHYPHHRHKVIYYPHRYYPKSHYRHFYTYPYKHHYGHHPKPYYKKYRGNHYRRGDGYYRPHKYSGKHHRTTGYGSRHGGARHRR